MQTQDIQNILDTYRLQGVDISKLSDGYHTFDELYFHRMVLFTVICNTYKEQAWKSKLHADGTMYEGYFIVGISIEKVGDYSYHFHKDYWDFFNDIQELERSPKWDGHRPSDITRLLTLTALRRATGLL